MGHAAAAAVLEAIDRSAALEGVMRVAEDPHGFSATYDEAVSKAPVVPRRRTTTPHSTRA